MAPTSTKYKCIAGAVSCLPGGLAAITADAYANTPCTSGSLLETIGDYFVGAGMGLMFLESLRAATSGVFYAAFGVEAGISMYALTTYFGYGLMTGLKESI